MKIIITEHQFRTVFAEQNRIVGFAKDLYNKHFGDDEPPKPKQQTVSKPSVLLFTPKNFANYVKQIGVAHPDVAIAQAMLESGNFKSDLFLENNNIFGMKYPSKRNTTAIGKIGNNFAVYKSWQDSVLDYKLWQKAWEVTNISKENFISKLDKIYCHPPHCVNNIYSKKILSLLSKASSLLS